VIWWIVQLGVIAFVLVAVWFGGGHGTDYLVALGAGVAYAYVLTLGHSMINDWIAAIWRWLTRRQQPPRPTEAPQSLERLPAQPPRLQPHSRQALPARSEPERLPRSDS
jgi:predicted phage tail protein